MPRKTSNFWLFLSFLKLFCSKVKSLKKLRDKRGSFVANLPSPYLSLPMAFPMKLEQNFVKYFVHFLGNGVSRKNAFEIYWPLEYDHWVLVGPSWPKPVEFCDLVGVGIVPLSKKWLLIKAPIFSSNTGNLTSSIYITVRFTFQAKSGRVIKELQSSLSESTFKCEHCEARFTLLKTHSSLNRWVGENKSDSMKSKTNSFFLVSRLLKSRI